MDEQIHGLSMRDCAEIMSKDGELKAQYGEPAYKPHFHQYLAQRGVDENTWAHSWNGWWTRMQADPSGQLHAKFATMQQQLTMQAHMADVPDAGSLEGVSLEQYAKVMAKIAGGEDANAVLAAEGLPMDQWQRAQTAWNAAMAADTDHHITTQYGMHYAKHTPGFQANMEAQTAAIMAADHAERAAGRPDEPEVEYTFADMVREMEDPTPNKRWDAAHHVCNRWDIGDKSDPALDAAAKRAYTLLNECLERHNEFTLSNAESAGKDLMMFASEGFLTPEQAAESKGNMERCLNRAREGLATAEAAFAPIADKAVPERVRMQTQIQDYRSLVEEMSEWVSEWDDNYNAPSSASETGGVEAAASMASSGSSAIQTNGGGGGFLDMLKKIPIIGNIIRLLGL